MREVTKYGKTVAEAVSFALKELNATSDQVTSTVLEQPRKGFLGIGARKALVKVTLTKTPFDYGIDYLTEVINKSGLTVKIQVIERGAQVCRCVLVGKDAAQLIGKHGATLNALQTLADHVAAKEAKQHVTFFLDAEHYRETRKQALVTLAKRMAKKTLRTNHPHRLEAMPAFERKIVHQALANNPKIQTFSNGEEPKRYLTIAPRRS
ncbi:RNA-binding cell elongation regulator Jag/EloR [Sporolactobacillus inulinus]|uniref:RNA-binding protein KhpB n=2 Tax=Sporolactobacillus inulinus TaxID=2078 RepID=A0A4Y1ZDR8_9BACL|nr:RNA-binding cell elongation regulator Jag/EloR [Sporolactobacillus inulinus]KLI03772.1 hypothetical protein SINU_01060 [Sporolactobacillus inulinus CASD]GAY77215.1 RNA-binding protein Jag [Sporolactobacillus inulinus]GEB77526.1 protein jag [Sporolactobacillus inulinus]